MRILMMTQLFDPEPDYKGLIFAKELQRAGHEVEVVTGFPNYPGGKLYPGYRVRWLQREMIDGVPVNRIPLYPSHDSSAFRRALNYLSFAVSACTFAVFGAKKADVIYAYDPPMSVPFAASVVGLLRRTPVVLDINDLWPDSIHASGMLRSRLLLGLVGMICQWTYSRASRVVVVTPGFRRRLIERGVPAAKIDLIYNWCDEQALRSPGRIDLRGFGLEGRFNVVYAGNMGIGQELQAVLRAARRVAAIEPQVQFVFVGTGVDAEEIRNYARELKVDNVRFFPWIPMADVGAVLAAANVLLVHLRDDPLYEITIPGKTAAYLAVGKPILMAVKGDAADLVMAAGAGVCARPEDEESIAEAVLELCRMPPEKLEEMGRRGSEYYSRHLNLARATEQWVRVLEAARKPGHPPA